MTTITINYTYRKGLFDGKGSKSFPLGRLQAKELAKSMIKRIESEVGEITVTSIKQHTVIEEDITTALHGQLE